MTYREARIGRGREEKGEGVIPLSPLTRPVSRRGGEKKGEGSEERETGRVEER